MKKEYKFLIDLCNAHKAPSYEDKRGFSFWWHTATGYGYITPKSDFVDHIIKTLTKKDKNFPKEEFLKQVKCKYEGFQLIDIFYTKKLEREHHKELVKQSEYDDYSYEH